MTALQGEQKIDCDRRQKLVCSKITYFLRPTQISQFPTSQQFLAAFIDNQSRSRPNNHCLYKMVFFFIHLFRKCMVLCALHSVTFMILKNPSPQAYKLPVPGICMQRHTIANGHSKSTCTVLPKHYYFNNVVKHKIQITGS